METIYWYEAVVTIGSKVMQKYLFKSPRLYEVGDFIIRRYSTGAVARMVITYPYGTACPEHELNLMSAKAVWTPILSEI